MKVLHLVKKEPSFFLSQDKHCLLELGLPSVERLLKHGIYPIVVHILPKTKKHKKLRYVFLLNVIKSLMFSWGRKDFFFIFSLGALMKSVLDCAACGK